MEGKYKALIIISCICLGSIVGLEIYNSYIDTTTNTGDDNDDDNGDTIPYIPRTSPLIINHTHAHKGNLTSISDSWISYAKGNLSIAYFHTSHGSQLTTGMSPLGTFMGRTHFYGFNASGTGGALKLFEPDEDDGYPYDIRDLSDYVNGFDDTTRSFLSSHSGYNVIMWSWCSMETNLDDVDTYLENMNQLEHEYPGIQFVYMTGHLNGWGESGSVHIANERVREYCLINNKILYDFANIESYDPDDKYWLDKYSDDNCTYDGNGNNMIDEEDRINYNWAIEWQEAHTEDIDWYDCSCAHSQALNGNMKAYAAWYLFAKLAGWEEN